MCHKGDSSLKGKADNSSFVLQAMQQQFEQLNFVLGEVRDMMDLQDVVIRNLQGGRDKRRREPRVENEYENEGDGEDEEDLASEVGSGRHRRFRRERGHEGNRGGSRSMEDYHKEMKVAMIRVNVEEDREATMARFLSGLNRDIANVIELQHYVEIEDMVHMTMKVERQLKRKGTARYTSVSNTTWKSKWDRNDPAEAKRKTEPPMGKDEGTSNKPKVESQPSRNRDIKCFKCLGSEAHRFSMSKQAGDDYARQWGGKSLVARRALNTHIKVDDAEQQRENIFHTRCHVNNKDEVFCDVVPMHAGCHNPIFTPGIFSGVGTQNEAARTKSACSDEGSSPRILPKRRSETHFPRTHRTQKPLKCSPGYISKSLESFDQVRPSLTKVAQAFRRYQDRRNPTSGATSTTRVKTGRQDKVLLKVPGFPHRRCHACAQSLPDSQQVDLRARAHWKEDTSMHDVELSDRQEFIGASRNPDRKTALKRTKNTPVDLCSRGHISQVQARIPANPEPCKNRQRKLSDGTKNVKIRHRELGQICARTGTRFEKKRAGSKTHFFSRTAAFARRVFPTRNKLIREPGCVGKMMTPATT
uniref:Uncharacterized protein n=1 Tax=Fagus sylvatica TaxID=28930 RepID=A0A2N9HAP5_FAGSY